MSQEDRGRAATMLLRRGVGWHPAPRLRFSEPCLTAIPRGKSTVALPPTNHPPPASCPAAVRLPPCERGHPHHPRAVRRRTSTPHEDHRSRGHDAPHGPQLDGAPSRRVSCRRSPHFGNEPETVLLATTSEFGPAGRNQKTPNGPRPTGTANRRADGGRQSTPGVYGRATPNWSTLDTQRQPESARDDGSVLRPPLAQWNGRRPPATSRRQTPPPSPASHSDAGPKSRGWRHSNRGYTRSG